MDLWRSGMKNYLFEELSTNEKYNVRLKIATRKYNVFDGYIIVNINLKEPKNVKILEKDKQKFCSEFSVWEPIYKKLEAQLQETEEGHFIETLEQYKRNGGELGLQIKNKLFIKFYHSEKPDDIERDDVGRKWIDYNAQLSRAKCIYDAENGCGIWVTNSNFIYEAMNAVSRYGEDIMVLAPIDDVEYIIADNEIVGDRFEIKMYGPLSDESTWNNLWKLFGDKVIEDMPFYVRDSFAGAQKIYDKYLKAVEKNNTKKSIIYIVKSIINRPRR